MQVFDASLKMLMVFGQITPCDEQNLRWLIQWGLHAINCACAVTFVLEQSLEKASLSVDGDLHLKVVPSGTHVLVKASTFHCRQCPFAWIAESEIQFIAGQRHWRRGRAT